jgi:hypothetical protein
MPALPIEALQLALLIHGISFFIGFFMWMKIDPNSGRGTFVGGLGEMLRVFVFRIFILGIPLLIGCKVILFCQSETFTLMQRLYTLGIFIGIWLIVSGLTRWYFSRQ